MPCRPPLSNTACRKLAFQLAGTGRIASLRRSRLRQTSPAHSCSHNHPVLSLRTQGQEPAGCCLWACMCSTRTDADEAAAGPGRWAVAAESGGQAGLEVGPGEPPATTAPGPTVLGSDLASPAHLPEASPAPSSQLCLRHGLLGSLCCPGYTCGQCNGL